MNCAGYRWRGLTPAQQQRIRATYAAGATTEALATAYGVSQRTIQRYVARGGRPTYSVTVAGFTATYELEDGYPVQVTPWVPER